MLSSALLCPPLAVRVPLATALVLSWCLMTKAIPCVPNTRYSLKYDCSAFVICDANSNPNTFRCPSGLHYNANKSYCDWPYNAACKWEDEDDSKIGIGEENPSGNVPTGGDGHLTRGMDRNVTFKVIYEHVATQTKDSDDEVSRGLKSETQSIKDGHFNAEAEEGAISVVKEATDKSSEESQDKSKESNENSASLITSKSGDSNDSSKLKDDEIISDKNVDSKENNPKEVFAQSESELSEGNPHSILRRKDESGNNREITKEENLNIYEENSFNPLGEGEVSEISDANNKTSLYNSISKEHEFQDLPALVNYSLVTMINETEHFSADEDISDVDNNENLRYEVNLNVTMHNLDENLGYDIASLDTNNTTSENPHTNKPEPAEFKILHAERNRRGVKEGANRRPEVFRRRPKVSSRRRRRRGNKPPGGCKTCG